MFILCSVQAEAQRSAVRVLHAVPDAPQLTVYIDGVVAFEDVVYRTITRYHELAAGSHRIKFVPAVGPAAGADAKPMLSVVVNASAGQMLTIAAIGCSTAPKSLVLKDRVLVVGSAGNANRVPPNADIDGLKRPSPPLKMESAAHIRVANVALDASPVDFVLDTGPVSYLARALAFGSGSIYIPIRSGRHTVRIRRTGSSSSLYVIPMLDVGRLGAFTIYLIGRVQGKGAEALDTLIVPDGIRAPAPSGNGPPQIEDPPLRLPPDSQPPSF